MTVTEAAIRAMPPGGRLEIGREGGVRTVVERSADGTTRQWVRETLNADGRVTSRLVTRTERDDRPPVPAERVRLPRGRPLSPKEPVPAAVIAFGHRLRVWRMTAGLTQTQLAVRVGMLPPVISLIESGQREPVWSLVLTLADALGVSTEDFREKPGATVLPQPQKTPATFAEMLTAKRVAAGLSQSEVARRAGVTPTAISRYERGRHKPTPAVVRRLAAALGCSADDFRELPVKAAEREGKKAGSAPEAEAPPPIKKKGK